MGAGIAQVAASTGHKVTLVDISQQVNIVKGIVHNFFIFGQISYFE